jgi:hypothetical protein
MTYDDDSQFNKGMPSIPSLSKRSRSQQMKKSISIKVSAELVSSIASKSIAKAIKQSKSGKIDNLNKFIKNTSLNLFESALKRHMMNELLIAAPDAFVVLNDALAKLSPKTEAKVERKPRAQKVAPVAPVAVKPAGIIVKFKSAIEGLTFTPDAKFIEALEAPAAKIERKPRAQKVEAVAPVAECKPRSPKIETLVSAPAKKEKVATSAKPAKKEKVAKKSTVTQIVPTKKLRKTEAVVAPRKSAKG